MFIVLIIFSGILRKYFCMCNVGKDECYRFCTVDQDCYTYSQRHDTIDVDEYARERVHTARCSTRLDQ